MAVGSNESADGDMCTNEQNRLRVAPAEPGWYNERSCMRTEERAMQPQIQIIVSRVGG
jgi:hypothetical protein